MGELREGIRKILKSYRVSWLESASLEITNSIGLDEKKLIEIIKQQQIIRQGDAEHIAYAIAQKKPLCILDYNEKIKI